MIDCEKLRCLIRIELKSDYTLEYAIQNVTIAYTTKLNMIVLKC